MMSERVDAKSVERATRWLLDSREKIPVCGFSDVRAMMLWISEVIAHLDCAWMTADREAERQKQVYEARIAKLRADLAAAAATGARAPSTRLTRRLIRALRGFRG